MDPWQATGQKRASEVHHPSNLQIELSFKKKYSKVSKTSSTRDVQEAAVMLPPVFKPKTH